MSKPDPNRLRAIRNQAREGAESLEEAQERMAEVLGADRVAITVKDEKISAHVTWRQDNE